MKKKTAWILLNILIYYMPLTIITAYIIIYTKETQNILGIISIVVIPIMWGLSIQKTQKQIRNTKWTTKN